MHLAETNAPAGLARDIANTDKQCAALDFVPQCMLCGDAGVPFRKDLSDLLYRTPGTWTYNRCRSCRFVWLSPRPAAQRIHEFYRDYHTHTRETADARSSKLKLKRALYAAALQSHSLAPSRNWYRIGRLLQHFPFTREMSVIETMYIGSTAPGKLLDVGCGNGHFLSVMQAAGWQVTGVEPDPTAAELTSRRLGIEVFPGELHVAGFQPDTFDAITLHHVIEHVSDPRSLIAECVRILKPNGRMTVVTPNINSLGSAVFGRSWRGLEPPRHFHLFCRDTLRVLVGSRMRIDFVRTTPRTARGIWKESIGIAFGHSSLVTKLIGNGGQMLFQLIAEALHVFAKGSGEELALAATKLGADC